MTNFEYFKDEIIELVTRSRCIAVVHGKPIDCAGTLCENCELFAGIGKICRPNRKAWLNAEHIEKPKLTKKERMFCELVETGWITRDENGAVFYSTNKPVKVLNTGKWQDGMQYIDIYDRFPDVLSNSFSFITWDDKEPWSVEELLKLEVEE